MIYDEQEQQEWFNDYEAELRLEPELFEDPLDALVYLTETVGGSEVKKFLEQL